MNRTMLRMLSSPRREPRPESRRDALTGLAGRAAFLDRLEARLPLGGSFAVVCVGIDRMDAVEDALGPLRADAFVAEAALRLDAATREGEAVARVASATFAVLLEDVDDPAMAAAVAARLQAALSRPAQVDGDEVFVTASAGFAMGPGLYRAAEDVLRDAGAALGRARGEGRGRLRGFEAWMHEDARERLRLEAALQRATAAGEFVLHYQPIVSLETGRVTAFEALLRWRHPERGLLAPGEFLAAAEELGLIVPIGRWALGEACRQAATWSASGVGEPVGINVNLSVQQLRDPGVVDDVEAAVAAAGIAPRLLRLEITEGALMEAGEAGVNTLCRLKSTGVQLCVDDFGVGYSSLSYLHRFPVDVLKVDRSFVAGLGVSGETLGIVRAIAGLAHALGILVVAEGVETELQLQLVRSLECGFAQGYLFAPPTPADDAGYLLAMGRRW